MSPGSSAATALNIAREGLTVLPPILAATSGVVSNEQNIDYVLLHGLNGHPKETWEHDNGFYWPAQLRKDIPEARIMVYGYNAVFERALVQNKTTIGTIAEQLVSSLIDEREGSLALVTIHSDRNSGLDTSRIRLQNSMYDSIVGLVFMGTPHAGSAVAAKKRVRLLQALAKASFKAAPERLVRALEANSDELLELSDNFEKTTIFTKGEIEICSYYETMSTKFLGEEVVPHAMAKLHYRNEHPEGIIADHRNMVRFTSATDRTYVTVMKKLRRMGEDGLRTRGPNARQGRKLSNREVVYRIRQLPSPMDKTQLPELLVKISESFGPPDNILIYSLASSLSPFERFPTTTATVAFKRTPSIFDDGGIEWTFLAKLTGLQQNIVVDVHFWGFTALNDVDPDLHTIDCIAICGLGSHPFNSWKREDSKSNFMWLGDGLPVDLQRIRVIIYGHDTRAAMSESAQTVDDIALSLITRLESIGRSSLSAKPLVFLAHSLGGIVLKRALIEMANSDQKWRFMLDAVNEVILFGVPNQGMLMSHLLPMVQEQIDEGTAFLKDLSVGSTYLLHLEDQFSGIATLRKVRLVSIFETKRSQIAQKSSVGKWERTGPYEVLVQKKAAIHRGSQPSDIFPIHENHLDIAKFTEGSPDYRVIATNLHEISEMHLTQMGMKQSREISQINWVGSWIVSGFSKPLDWFRGRVKEALLGSAGPGPRTGSQALQGNDDSNSKTDELNQDGHLHFPSRLGSPLLVPILQSLNIKETALRIKEIDHAYSTTFDWIWTNPNLGFESWLQDGRGIYWISGKPGSGKSTLMKYISTHVRTSNILGQSDPGRKRVRAEFFFHDRGSHIQKSFEGLLHSILYQVLCAEPRLAEEIMPTYVDLKPAQQRKWSLPYLEKAFAQLLAQDTTPVDIYIFLDALDEYDGHPEVIADFIKSAARPPASAATQVKICFSSRLWDEFDQFKQCAGFKIHEQTQQDIQDYVKRRLTENSCTARLISSGDDQEPLAISNWVSEIAQKAEGVFLWIRLVMDDLLSAHTKWTSLPELDPPSIHSTWEKLQELTHSFHFPNSLGDFYKRLIERIPEQYRAESYAMLEIVLRSEGRIDLDEFRASVNCASEQTLKDCIAKFPSGTEDSGSIQRWLKSRCGGLIEIVDDWEALQFMHQTVKDYICRPGFKNWILKQSHLFPGQNGHSFLAKYGLALMLEDWKASENFVLRSTSGAAWKQHLRHAYLAELTTGKSQRELLDEADVGAFRWNSPGYSIVNDSAQSFAVVANLRLYIQEKLEETHCVNSHLTKSLLHYVVEATIDFVYTTDFHDLAEMARLLLCHGANRDAIFEGMTPFQLLFSRCIDGGGGSPISTKMINVARAFLENGQDPNTVIHARVLYPGHRFKELTTCTSLHVSSIQMVRLLLQYGVDINALDGNGLTALDICFEAGGDYWSICQAYEKAMLLLENGGRITKAGERARGRFLNILEGYESMGRFVIDERMRRLPQLQKPRQAVPKVELQKFKHALLKVFGPKLGDTTR